MGRRALFIVCFVAAVLLAKSSAPGQATPTGTVVLKNVRVIDGLGGIPLEGAAIVIDSGKIQAVGPVGKMHWLAGAQVIDYQGKTVIPGLISDHSHVGQVDGTGNSAQNYNRPNILRQLRQYEVYGVTTIMALGLNGDLFYPLRAELHDGKIDGADLFGADRGLGIPDGAPPAPPISLPETQLYRVSTPQQAVQAVDEMATRHPDLIKLWLDDFHGSLRVKMQPDVYKAIIDEAHKKGIRVAAHIYYLADAKDVVNAGVDIIAHGVRDQAVDAEFIRSMKERAVWYIPTIDLDESSYLFAEYPAWLSRPFVQRALQPALRAQIDDPAWRAKTLSNQKQVETAKASVAINKRNLKTLYDAGVKIGFGTDSGAVPLRVPGFAEHRELELFVESGLTPVQAIDVATHNAAALLRLSDRGIIAPGMLADLVVVDGNPDADIENVHKIAAVWHRGKLVSVRPDAFTP
jgi:imidazolonepropionase-like amidohydrolase